MSAADTRHRQIVRGAWWAVFVALVMAELAFMQLDWAVRTEAVVSYTLTYFVPMFLAVGVSLVLAVRLRGVERRFWGLLAAAVSAVLVPELYWVWYETFVDYHGPTVPTWWELGHLVGIVLFYILVVSMTELGEAPAFTRLRFYLDILGALILAFVVVYWYWTLPLFYGLPMGGWPVAAVAAMYPVSSAVMLVTTALIFLGWKAYRWRSWERLVSVCFVIYGLGLLTFPAAYASWITAPVVQGSDPYTIVLGFGMYLLFMAGVYRMTASPDEPPSKPWPVPEVRPSWVPMLYPTLLAAGLVVLGMGALQVAGLYGGVVVVVATAVLGLVLIVRSWSGSVELAHHRARSITDAVTGAYNPRYLHERLPRELDEATAENLSVAAIAFDVVDFRNLVEMSGPVAGDRLLAAVVDTMRAELPPSATVYRVGRDEFLAVAVGVSAQEAAGLARRVNARIGAEVAVDGVAVALSAGVAVSPEHAEDAETLVSRAFASQQLARAAERTDVIVYDAEVVDATDPLVRLDRARLGSHRAKLRALAAAVDARDATMRQHSQAVAELVSAFALTLDLSEEQTRTLEMAAYLHDIGKIGVADEILLKPDVLTPEEWACVHQHPLLSERLVGPAGMPEILPVVRSHHECWDGLGYPDGLQGEEIPLEARILSICDAFEAMTSGRRWRAALSVPQAAEEIERCAGTRFDPALAAAFTEMVARMHGRPIAERMATSRRDLGLAEE